MNAFPVDDSIQGSQRENGAARRWAASRRLLVALSLAFACQSALAQAMYRIKPLGYLGGCKSSVPTVVGLNGKDEMAGNACNADGDSHAFKWRNDGHPMVDLGPGEVGYYSEAAALNASGLVTGFAQDSTGTFAFMSSGDGTPMKRIYDGLGGSYVAAYAINDFGQLTGDAVTAGGTQHAFLWKDDGSPMRDLGTLGGSGSYGNAINESGQIAGLSYLPGNATAHAFVWRNDGSPMLDLGTLGGNFSSACCINASGQIAGSSYTVQNSRNHAYFWRNDGTPMQDLGTLRGGGWNGSFPSALNDSGQIAGYSYTSVGLNSTKQPHAFVWMNDGTAMRDLGTFGGTHSQANDINASGQVTGDANLTGDTVSHAFLWRNDGTKIQDLNKLIDPTDPLKPHITLTHGRFINDPGNILAEGTDSLTGLQGLYLLRGTVLTLAPRSLAFGNQPINTTSAAKSATMTNTSAKIAAIASIALAGSGAGQFATTNNCGSSLVGHATCTIKITFKPTTKGAKTAVLNVNGGGEGLRSVTLTGTGT